MKHNDPQNIEQNFDELELVAEKAGELNDRVGKIENELGAQTKTLESAAMVLDAAIKGLGALKHQVLENDIGALQLALNDKTAHLAREIGRFESAVAEIDRRAEAGDEQLATSLRDIALGLRSSFDAKSAEIAEWSARVEREIAAHSVALAAIPPVIKGADAKPFNPRGEWQAGMVANSLDVVSYNGSSYISNVDGNTDKPSRSDKYTVLAKRSGNGAGGATDFGSLTGTILPAQVVPGAATYAVGDVLYAGTTGALSKLGAGSSGQLLSTQGAGAAPIWVTATGGAGDMNGPASATDNAVARFDGTGGKTVQNSTVTISDTGDITAAGKLFTADGTNAAPAIAIASSTGTGLYLDAANTLGVATGGNGTVTFSTASGVANITGHGVRSLTITGGSSGASLVLGQGATAGNATITPTGTGVVAIAGTGSKLTIAGTTAATSTTTGAFQVAGGAGIAGAIFGGSTASFAPTLTTSGAIGLSVSPSMTPLAANLYGARVQATVASGASSGGTVSAMNASTTNNGTTNIADVENFTSTVNQSATSGTLTNVMGFKSTLALLNSGNVSSFYGFRAGDAFASSTGTLANQYAFYVDALSRGTVSNYAFYSAGAGKFQISDTTSASSSTTGALTVGNGSAATNVAIGGGNINAGGTVAIGNTVAAAVSVASTHKVTMVIGGVTYYLLASNV